MRRASIGHRERLEIKSLGFRSLPQHLPVVIANVDRLCRALFNRRAQHAA